MLYIYPTNAELMEIEQDLLPVLTMNDPLLAEHFPIRNLDASALIWEVENNYTGLQGARGLNGDPSRVKGVGGRRYTMEPGVYGEFATVDEQELTTRRSYGSFNTPVDITDLVRKRQDQLLNRRIMRIRKIGWDLVTSGSFSVFDGRGQQIHTDQFDVQTSSAAVPWSTSATATPLANFRAVKLLARGTSCRFGAGAKAYMNQATFNELVSNTNAADIAGRRTSGLNTVLNLDEINRVLMGEDLPQIVIYDDGYIDDAGVFQLFVPNDKVVIIGQRTNGAALGEYLMTRNANNPNLAPGPYTYVVDSATTGQPVPRKITVHDGHNGGPTLYYPNGVVVMSV